MLNDTLRLIGAPLLETTNWRPPRLIICRAKVGKDPAISARCGFPSAHRFGFQAVPMKQEQLISAHDTPVTNCPQPRHFTTPTRRSYISINIY